MVKNVMYIIVTFIICLNVLNSTIVYAAVENSGDSIINGARDFVNNGKEGASKTLNEAELKNTSNTIYNIVLAIAMVIAVAVGVALGIKFMTSSVEEQAKIKEMLVPYIAGCIVVFGSIGIWKLAVNAFSKF